MNDSNLNYDNSGNGFYQATGNMNTAMESLSSSNINNATSVNVLGPEYSVGSSYDLNSGVNNFSQGALSGMDNFNQGVSNNASGFAQNELISGNVGVPLIEENNFSQVTSSGMGGFAQSMSNGFVQGHVIGSEGFTQSVDVNNLSVNQTGGDNNSYLNQDNLNQYMGLDNNQVDTNKFIVNPNNSSGSSFLGGGAINPQAITNSDSSVYMGGDAITTTKKVKYQPILETNNKPSNNNDNNGSFKDTIVIIGITLVLLLCVWLIPVIYDLIIGVINLS